MDQLVLLTAATGLGLGMWWLGLGTESPLMQVLLRPAVLGLLGTLMLVLAAGLPHRWPFGLVASAAVLGAWEGYSGAYRLVGTPGIKRKPAELVKVCAIWLINTLASLILLNIATQMAFPGTFVTRGGEASPLDVAYLTMMTFASGGYGDVLPATSLGKILLMTTSLAGLVYATILFAALFQVLRED